MSSVELLLRLALAVVFLIAATGKLGDLERSRDTLAAFGVPRNLAAIGGTGLPWAELAIAVALLPTSSARWGAIGGGALLVTFTAGIGYALRQGRTPDCNCFGVIASEQISSRTLLRNAALIVLAGVAAWRAPGSSMSAWTSSAGAADLVAAIAVVATACTLVLAAQMRRALIETRVELATAESRRVKPGLQPGEDAPDFELPSLGDGRRVTLPALLEQGMPVVLVFASQSCGPCVQMLPELIRWSETLAGRLTFALIESGVEDPDGLQAQISHHGTILTVIDHERAVAEAYQVSATPTAILIDPDGHIGAAQTSGAGNIEGLIRSALERKIAPVPA
jgi:thiol-disulfide isomerase/thioredoxin